VLKTQICFTRPLLCVKSNVFICDHTEVCGPVYLSRYSDWLRAGRSGDRIPVGGRDFPHLSSCTMGNVSFLVVKSGRGVTLTPHPTSSAVGHERVELYLYSPCEPYSLYRASVPVQGWPLPFFYIQEFRGTEYFIAKFQKVESTRKPSNFVSRVFENNL